MRSCITLGLVIVAAVCQDQGSMFITQCHVAKLIYYYLLIDATGSLEVTDLEVKFEGTLVQKPIVHTIT